MRTTLILRDELVRKAARLTGIAEKTALVHAGLRSSRRPRIRAAPGRPGRYRTKAGGVPTTTLGGASVILADTSVWIAHFRHGSAELARALEGGEVLCHAHVVGELACGNIRPTATQSSSSCERCRRPPSRPTTRSSPASSGITCLAPASATPTSTCWPRPCSRRRACGRSTQRSDARRGGFSSRRRRRRARFWGFSRAAWPTPHPAFTHRSPPARRRGRRSRRRRARRSPPRPSRARSSPPGQTVTVSPAWVAASRARAPTAPPGCAKSTFSQP